MVTYGSVSLKIWPKRPLSNFNSDLQVCEIPFHIQKCVGTQMPFHLLGPLDTKWKVRDPVKGFITNTDGTRSAVVHQFDRQKPKSKGNF